MNSYTVQKTIRPLSGTLCFPGDKSLSHRAIIFGALAEGVSEFTNVLAGEDCVCTRKAFEDMGVRVESLSDTHLRITGRGLRGLQAPKKELYLGNSGTSMRLLLGILSGFDFEATLTGDASLSSRPMRRVTDYLKQMGARIDGRDSGNFAPITIHGGHLEPIRALLPMASAQVKSALLLAGLFAEGETAVTEPSKSRDHTERFLSFFGGRIKEKDLTVSITGGQALQAKSFAIAGDISSAAFFMAASVLAPGSQIRFESILWNPTRTGIVDVLKRMGVVFEMGPYREEGPEKIADFMLKSGELRPFEIKKEELPRLIDEIPILTVLATQANGRSVIHDADELRVKETDRIESMVTMLSRMGAKIHAQGNTVIVEGPTPLHGAKLHSFKDHRTAMSLIIAGLIADGETIVEGLDCIQTSFPNFFDLLRTIRK
ncbi:MAG: 3-phosphoshikimate 1-carboxyvinyltransferase [Candidatus Omnitrophica bacterium]|nr:3-phosphoshikimate 1-carboxyvinyltransferase [Candidatus Omnitrophota bacterium]